MATQKIVDVQVVFVGRWMSECRGRLNGQMRGWMDRWMDRQAGDLPRITQQFIRGEIKIKNS